uniref:Ion transport domain-containing protein n=1 Tax=Anabas testudineus TaxID=64144 RepID=A0A7N6B3B4_ANATE
MTGRRRRDHDKKEQRTMLLVLAVRPPKLPWTLITRKKWRSPSLKLDSTSTLTSEPLRAVITRGIRGKEEDSKKRNNDKFNINRLFEAVASGDAKNLDGLYQYLHQNMKKLSDNQSHGKTALMKALLHLKDGKNEIVELLIDISEKLGDINEFVNAAYTNSYYKGQTALHIAIERRSICYVKLLVNKGADVHVRACGTFFQQDDGPSFYFGELPLSLAACTNQPNVVDFLMNNEYQRANAKLTDSQGNTVLHALVVVADNSEENTEFVTNMYDRILRNAARLHPKLKLEDIENYVGLTPLKLAAKTGKIGNRHEMLQTEPLSQLLDEKWKKFAGQMFCFHFLVYFLYLIIFTIVAYNKKNGEPPFVIENTTMDYLYTAGQLVTTLANAYFFVIGIIDMKRKRPKLKTLLIDGYYEFLFFVQGALFLVSAGLYLCSKHEYLCFLVMCLALSWVNLIYFSRGDSHMGIYSVMIQKMILSDILRFLFVYSVFLFGFSAAVVSLLIEPPERNITINKQARLPLFGPDDEVGCVKPTYRNMSYTTLELFKFTIGMGDMEFTEDYKYKEVFYILLIGYIILTYILLLNMLIALMNRTVENITMESTSIWKLQRAITILDMEKRLPNCLKKRFRCGAKKNLNTVLGDDCRQCLRVEEVNWNKWNINLGKINEDPGCCDRVNQPELDGSSTRPNRGAETLSF